MKTPFKFKQRQKEDYARAALHDGVILAHDTGTGKSLAAFAWPLLKVGWSKVQRPKSGDFGTLDVGLLPNAPVLIVAPGDLHQQLAEEGLTKFGLRVVPLPDQTTFLRLRTLHLGRWTLPPAFYITSYTQLSGNGVEPFPTVAELPKRLRELQITLNSQPSTLNVESWTLKVHSDYSQNIGETRHGIKCVYSPSLADLCQDAFACVVVDEGVKMKGEDTIVGRGLRQMNPRYRLVLTATPIKNRLPDVFRLAWWAAGGHAEATARFPYPDSTEARDDFAREFLVSERNLTKEAEARAEGERRRFVKLTSQISSVHRLWKLFGPIVLRRRKQDFGEDIVPMLRQVIRVPMGKHQAAVYAYHLKANYLDKNGKSAIGAKLQALRLAASAPDSRLLKPVR